MYMYNCLRLYFAAILSYANKYIIFTFYELPF